jgi:hypothetical protein
MSNSNIHAQSSVVLTLADQMDELSMRAQNVLAAYEEAQMNAQASGAFVGQGSTASVGTAGEVKAAQLKIQTKFQQVNQLLRDGTHHLNAADEQGHQMITQVVGGLAHQ